MAAKDTFKQAVKKFQRGLYSEAKESFEELKQQEKNKDVEKYIKVCNELLSLNKNDSLKELVEIRRNVFKEFDSDFDKIESNTDEDDKYGEKLNRLILNDQKHFIEKLKNVYQSVWHSGATIALEYNVTSTGVTISFWSKGNNSVLDSVKSNLLGQFPGTKFCEGENNSLDIDIPEDSGIGIVSCIPSFIVDDALIQGLETVFNGIKPTSSENSYDIIILAKSVSQEDILRKRQELCDYVSILSPYQKKNVTSSENAGKTVSNGFNAGLMVFGLPVNPSLGVNRNSSYSTSYSKGESYEITNYAIKHSMDLLQKQISRFDNGISYGMWQTAIYVSSKSFPTIESVVGSISSIVSGKETYVEVPFIKLFDADANDKANTNIGKIRDSVNCLNHPNIDNKNYISCLSSYELAQVMSLPRKSIPGFLVTYGVPFGRDVVDYSKGTFNKGDLEIGHFRYIHDDDGKDRPQVSICKDDLTMHTFVTGSTGKGKSNAIYQLLNKVTKANDKGKIINYMVIEPAKGEYKNVFGNANVYCSNPAFGKLLTINPFEFREGIHITEHIDRILEIFNACWPMYAAMPAVLKDAIIKSYEECGWNMETSKNYRGHIFPNFTDVSKWIDFVIDNSSYDKENKGAYKGSLKTRLNSLTNGINGRIFCVSKCVPDEKLFNENTIVDLSRIGSNETKSLIMGMMIIKMQEYYMTLPDLVNSPIRHITVLEEAHNILKRTSPTSGDVGNMVGKSVEMISNAIAEMRTYGEAFVIVDQSPSLMDMSVIRNTNTKIVLGLPDQTDRELVGKAMGLNDEQIRELAKLERGVAAVYQNNWAEAVLCQFDKFPDEDIHKYVVENDVIEYSNDIANYLINPELFKKYNLEEFNVKLDEANVSSHIRNLIIMLYRQVCFGNNDESSSEIKKATFVKICTEYFDFKQLGNIIISLPIIDDERIKKVTNNYLCDKYAINPELLEQNNMWNELIYKLTVAYAIGLSNEKVKLQLEEVRSKLNNEKII